MTKFKACFFVPFYPLIKGGAEYQSKIIAQELAKKGYEIVFISGGHEKEKVSFYDGFKVYELVIDTAIKARFFLYKDFMCRVHKIIKDEAPILIYQRILNTFTFHLSKFAKQQQIPFILHIADNYSVEFSKKLRSSLKRYLFRKILETSPSIICQTDYQISKINEWGYEPMAKIPNMHPEIIDERIERNIKRILWIGNAREVKQLELFLQLPALLKNDKYQFHVIGKLPDNQYGKGLLEKIKSCQNLTYHGSKENTFINSFLQTTGVLVNTSVSEGFSNTFIQAWMCGTPVVALNSDPDGLMTHHNLGIDCQGNFDLLPKAISNIIGNKDFLIQSNKIKQSAICLFSTEVNVFKLIELIKKIKSSNG
ncbi:Glycosyltransferase involved in cell wall bisynthesis [Maribacter sedimenticola]|uniref:Glycosyltransferase involved in cell wall bisynthesis n=1 Tax=Maribacter sedimenticola TaxID=228956 RepID=A0ABY1SKB9_9FLAO|nr:glycosyltransferase family 4 protein [Maribacter sedimenticola]SNR66947.1 Glycosyltransferase involved in cell wall bisynthesis [Maribacter sedimenticola]